MISTPLQSESSETFFAMKYFNWADNLAMNGVPISPNRHTLLNRQRPLSHSHKQQWEKLTRSDTITIEPISFWYFLSLFPSLVQNFFRFPRRPEPPTPLLVHLCPWSDSINSKKEQFLWFDDREQVRNVSEYGEKDLFFRYSEWCVVVVWMWTIVNDSIHVEI